MRKALITSLALSLLLTAAVQAGPGKKGILGKEKPVAQSITLDKLPATVLNAMKKVAGDAELTSIKSVTGGKKNKTIYQASYMKDGKSETVRVSEAGKVLKAKRAKKAK